MSYLTLSLIITILLLLGGAVLHIINLNKVYKNMVELVGPGVRKDALYKEMTVAQGSNFTAMAMAAWMTLFVAIAYLYFLIPGALPYNYMMLKPEWASNLFGFLIFGLLVTILTTTLIFLILDRLPNNFRNLKLSELYSFYNVSKNEKTFIGLTIPILSLSIVFSAYSGTIYPARNSLTELLSFFFLILSMSILFWPIWRGQE